MAMTGAQGVFPSVFLACCCHFSWRFNGKASRTSAFNVRVAVAWIIYPEIFGPAKCITHTPRCPNEIIPTTQGQQQSGSPTVRLYLCVGVSMVKIVKCVPWQKQRQPNK